jgi:hypothetical protein
MQSNTHEQQHTHLTQKSSTAASSALQHIVYTQHNAACTLHWTGKATGAAPRHEIGTKTTTALHYGKDQKYQKGKGSAAVQATRSKPNAAQGTSGFTSAPARGHNNSATTRQLNRQLAPTAARAEGENTAM